MTEKHIEKTPEGRPTFHGRVLLAEDNLTNQIVARGLLNLYCVEVVIAENGQKAVEQAESTQFDLIFMDCQMPVMDGYEATRHIRQLKQGKTSPDVPIIALSANALKGDEDECFIAGMNDHVAKPVSQDKIVAILTKWLPIR
ncbi:response regulator [Marinomonas colpomeniae]|uniref:Response regulator n=1 Tax=Marinomonas colpomeniae TaxID=2774408 RepID=A0ABR8P0W0_9GAMM|nr:response regulator [Marinomonas colpomeniae]MBD5770927.1 response regulator [Marinomonas colpomeniae]